MKRWRHHVFVFSFVAMLGLTGGLCVLQNALTEWRSRLGPRSPTGDVVIVAVDARSIEKLGVWPWSRAIHAELLNKLRVAGASEVAFDIDFGSRSTPINDDAFLKALEQFGGSTILPTFKQIGKDAEGGHRIYRTRPLPEFAAQAWLASVNVVPESNGLVRRYEFGEIVDGEFYPSLAALLGGSYITQPSSFYLDYGIDARRIPTFSIIDVLGGSVGSAELKGKRVVIGATAIELGDRFNVPRIGNLAGVELQALATEAVLQGRMLHKTSITIAFAGLIALFLLMSLLRSHWSPARQTFALLLLAVAAESTAAVLQARYPVIVDTAPWLAAVVGYIVGIWLDELDLRKILAKVSQQRFQSIAMSLGDGVICLNKDGKISFWNTGASYIFGYGADEALNQPFGMLCAGTELVPDVAKVARDPIELVGRRKNGEQFPLEVRFSSWPETDGEHCGAIVRDISIRKREEDRIRYLAMHDPLTGLANRTQLGDFLKARIADTSRTRKEVGVLLVDIDNFKEINDTLGHESGDKFLRTFARQLQECAGSVAVARMGGDEFVLVVEDTDAANKLDALARSISNIFAGRFTQVEGSAFLLSTSCGGAIHPQDASTGEELLAKADLALYRAKDSGKGRYVPYQNSFKEELEQRRVLEAELDRAVRQGEFELWYQPQVNLSDSSMIGVEALLRWRHPTRGVLAPGDFLDVLSSGNLAAAVGAWVLRTACEDGQRWHAAGHSLRVGVNLFPAQFHSGLPQDIERVLIHTGFAARLLELEVTENILLNEDDPKTIEMLHRIRALGVGIAFDDFGTGYASLSYLIRFPLDRLKIDRSFVRDFGQNDRHTAIVNAIVDLGRRLGHSVIAEGIESQGCAKFLQEASCKEGQGYHFGKPMSRGSIDNLLAANNGQLRRAATAA